MTDIFDAELEQRLVRYAAIDSQSDMDRPGAPSTECQHAMLDLMVEELTAIGAAEVVKQPYGTVTATIPGNRPGPTIGFLAHVDTAPQFNATGVKPRVIRGYNGGDITFPDAPDLVLSPKDFPYLAEKVGQDIITASGTTLLGADDKSGIAVIMTAARYLLANPDLPRPTIRIAFTPDEEIGRGVDARLPADLGADFAYTFDGGDLGEVVYETFTADFATVTVTGVSIHPGEATGKLVNAIHLASRIVGTLPQATLTPETTADREGFLHCVDMSGDAAQMTLRLILRDFELDGLAAKGDLLRQVCAAVAATEPRARHRRDRAAVPQHALLARGQHGSGRPRPRRAGRYRHRPDRDRDPRRDRRLAADRDGRALPQSLHRAAERAWPARVHFRAGHGPRDRTDARNRGARDRLSLCPTVPGG